MIKRQIVITITTAIAAILFFGCDNGTQGDNTGTDGDTDNDTDSDTDSEAAASLVGDIERDGNYVLEMTNGTETILFECTAAQGGLILKMALNGVNILAENTDAIGSIFWVAPQSDWNWPPPSSINTAAFTSEVDQTTHTITLTSEADPKFNYQIVKKFSPDLERFAVMLEYTIKNVGTASIQHAPWEVSRVLPGGITFFPTGTEVNAVDMTLIQTTDAIGVTWFDHTVDLPKGNHKYCADGSRGWLAHAMSNIVFIKSFDDQPASAKPTGQGEIQLYVSGGVYQEVEQMGAYQEIPAGGQINWTVRWYLRQVPTDAAVSVGNQPLVDFIDNLAI